jgi:hypothetical protein
MNDVIHNVGKQFILRIETPSEGGTANLSFDEEFCGDGAGEGDGGF